ncbi:flagellin N-terminal-like domain-containing protein [Halobacterium jilantaiense]|uniref:Flagellin N-terminal-like domain-containing protein n=1 Tax=Halobacterium jilantaiense TaxID=355548 RepID=A0A1I0MMB6_9EURY|nr:flagellin N-terminal-like domain-containing protein [Halobacterium jilantaiense]
MNGSSSRAVSPVIATVLLVAVVVVAAATTAVFVLDISNTIEDPAPVVGQSSGDLTTQDGNGGGIVSITHIAGDTLVAADLEIVVDADAACGKTGRLVNLPAEGDDPDPESEYVRGEDVFDNSANSVSGPIGEAGGEWTPGETVTFRLASSECALTRGDTITVRVVHTPSRTVVIDQSLTVTQFAPNRSLVSPPLRRHA